MSVGNRLINDVREFVTHNKVLCACTLGLAVLGYLGYRGVKWVLEKVGVIQQVDSVATKVISQRIHQPSLHKIGQIHRKTRPKSIASPQLPVGDQEKETVRPPSKRLRNTNVPETTSITPTSPWVGNQGPQIIQSHQSVEGFVNSSYSGAATERNKKYSERMRNISQYFAKNDVYPVRGDGNCFTNSAVAGLLYVMGKDRKRSQEIAQLISSYETRDTPYILPDVTQTAPQYNKVFTKEGDFKAVLDRINGDTFEISELIGDQSFISAFSRVIRYILVCEREQGGFEEGDIPGRCGEEIDMEAVVLLNRLFQVNASLIVLQGPNQASDPENPHEALQLVGRERFEGQRIVDMSPIDSSVIEGEFDFLILRKSGHFLAML